MGLYSNARRMVTVFCTAIIITTLMMLTLRITVFSDMAVIVSAGSPEAVSGMQGGEIEDNGDLPYKLNSKIVFDKSDAKGDVLILNPKAINIF